MKTTSNWLNSYLSEDLSAEKLADVLTMSGTEVEHTSDSDDGTLLQLEVTSNRVDCLGVKGLLREVCAVTGVDSKLESPAPKSASGAGYACSIADSALEQCSLYTTRVIRGVKIGPSPQWLQDRLEAIGVAAINNVVDITNLVLFEYSQPLHAFDLAKLRGPILVRRATKDEAFLAINHKEYKLGESDLVIADDNGAVALAGIMGGANTEISDATLDVVIESAYFEPRGVKATGRSMDKQHSENLESDSRYRFERGVDIGGVIDASHRAIELILELAGGELDGELQIAGKEEAGPLRALKLRSSAIERTLGMAVSIEECARIMRALGLGVTSQDADSLSVDVPTFRRDLEREIDLVEEIGRVVGLDAFESRLTLPIAPSRASLELEDRIKASAHLRSAGFNEMVTDTFVPAKGASALTPWKSGPALRARAPINTHWPCIRRSLMPSLLRVFGENQARSSREVAGFEMATLTLTDDKGGPSTKHVVSLVGEEFFALKGAVESLLSRLGVKEARWESSDFGLFAEGEGTKIFVGEQLLGVCGRVSAAVAKEYSLTKIASVAELDFDLVSKVRERVPMYTPVSRFPTVNRDLAVVVEESVRWDDIRTSIAAVGAEHLKDVTFFDEFRGKQVPKGKKSLAFAMVFRDESRTLVSEEVDAQVNAIIERLKSDCSAEVRS